MNERKRTSKSHTDRAVWTDDELRRGGSVADQDDFSMFSKEGMAQLAPVLYNMWNDPINVFPFFSGANLIPWQVIQQINRDFPTPNEFEYDTLGKEGGGDFRFNKQARMPDHIRTSIEEFHHPVLLAFLERSTGIKGLIPDPYLEDAGLEYSTKGASRPPSEERKTHSTLIGLHRRVGLIISASKNWQPEWGGDTDFFEGTEVKQSFQHSYNHFFCYDVQKALPQGFKPLKCPSSYARKALRLYFYTATLD